MGATIAVLDKKGEKATEKAVAMLKAFHLRNAETYGIATPTMARTEKSLTDLQIPEAHSHTAAGYVFAKILPHDKPQPLKIQDAALVFDGRLYPFNAETPDVETATTKIEKEHEEGAKNLIKENAGDFTFTIVEADRIIAGRAAAGTRPMYYGENAGVAAVASERKALWMLGIRNPRAIPAGSLSYIDKYGFKLKQICKLNQPPFRRMAMDSAAKRLQTLLEHSVRERVFGLKTVAVSFSGGLDSSMIALLAKNAGVETHLIHVSLEGQPETRHAMKAAEELKLPIHVYLYTQQDVQKAISQVLQLIEQPDPLKACVEIPLYWVAERTVELGLKVMLSGQGADELFAGYRRYVDCYMRYGRQKTQQNLLTDAVELQKNGFARDFTICNYHGVELRLPFAAYEVAEFALSLPLKLKLEHSLRTLRKLVLRKTAKNWGLPEFLVQRPKKAMQYSTGVTRTLAKTARSEGISMKEYVTRCFNDVTGIESL